LLCYAPLSLKRTETAKKNSPLYPSPDKGEQGSREAKRIYRKGGKALLGRRGTQRILPTLFQPLDPSKFTSKNA
jgi:hypothetical protein